MHRDVKPSNVLLDQQGDRDHAYLADFGLTRSGSAAGPTDGQFMGTVDYVAPEQIRGDDVDGRADQYALGCLLFECLTGSLPFRHRSEVAAIFAHLEEAAPAASERHETLPPAVDPVLARAMAKEPAERYDSCRALVAATHDALGLATPPSRRARWLVPVLALAVLALAIAAVVLGATAGRRPPPPGRTARSRRSIRARTASAARTEVPGYPQAVTTTAGGISMADFREGVLWRYDPTTKACSGSRPTASRATSPRSATRCTSPSTATRARARSRATTRRRASASTASNSSRARSRPVTASCGRQAVRSSIA